MATKATEIVTELEEEATPAIDDAADNATEIDATLEVVVSVETATDESAIAAPAGVDPLNPAEIAFAVRPATEASPELPL